MNTTVFEAINITKKYRNTLALNQVSMSVMQGDIYGFIGENGAGKMNCTPFVRQYGILSNKWGVFLCQKEYQTNDIRRNSKNW